MKRLSLHLACLFMIAAPCATAQRTSSAAAAATPDSTLIRLLVDSARVAGLPQRPLRSVLEEGRQRNESSTRVLAALRRCIEVLSRARTALGPRASDAEVDAGASVLLSGADVRTLTAVRAARPVGNLTVALVVLADLVERGVALPRAEDAVVTLTRVGATDAAFNDFRLGVQQDLASGQNAESSLLRRTRETVSRQQIGGGRRPPLELRDITIFGSMRAAAPPPATDALTTESPTPRASPGFWTAAGGAVPFTSWPVLRLDASAAGTFDRALSPGGIGGEVLLTAGLRREREGAELGVGLAATTGFRRHVPLYAAAWMTRGATSLRAEARLAAAPSARRAWEPSPIERLETGTLTTGDTLPTPGIPVPPVTSPDSNAVPGAAKVQSAVSELRFAASRRVLLFTVGASTGFRFVDHRPLDSWSVVSISADVHPQMAILAGLSARHSFSARAAQRPSLGFVGLSMHPGSRTPRTTAPAIPLSAPSRPVGIVRVTATGIAFEVIADAERVDVAGDFTEWRTVHMENVGSDRWQIALPEGQSVVRLRIRLDDGVWLVPSGVSRGRSAFGEDVGVIVVDHAPDIR